MVDSKATTGLVFSASACRISSEILMADFSSRLVKLGIFISSSVDLKSDFLEIWGKKREHHIRFRFFTMILEEITTEDSTNSALLKDDNPLFEKAFDLRLEPRGADLLKDYASEHGLSDEQRQRIINELNKGLQWKQYEYDFLKGKGDVLRIPVIRLAAAIFDYLKDLEKLEVLILTSLYLNCNVPWSSEDISEAAMSLADKYIENGARVLAEIKPSLLSIPNVKVSLSGYKKAGSSATGLMPSLGFSGAGRSLLEDDKRKDWKSSDNIRSLSTVCGFLLLPNDDTQFQENWAVTITFILNVLDDSDPLFRAQGCYLLNFALQRGHQSVLIKSGLIDLFLESVETCLNFLPSLTPADVSLKTLKAAFPLLLQLKVLRETPCLLYIEILEKNILGSISHVQGRDTNAGTNSVVSFLLQQAAEVIKAHLKGAVLGCFLRLNYTLNQLITSPFLIDTEGGAEVVDLALRVHGCCLETFVLIQDAKGRELFASYKYDLLAAWIVLLKRVVKFGVGTSHTRSLVYGNIQMFSGIVDAEELRGDYEAAAVRNPDSMPKWDDIIAHSSKENW